MLENANGKLLVYASIFKFRNKRLESISAAAERMAKLLKLNFEIVTFKEKFTSIYVYYKSGEEEPIPLYCDKDGKANVNEVYDALKSMMFVLSFHPRHSSLRRLRKEIMRFS